MTIAIRIAEPHLEGTDPSADIEYGLFATIDGVDHGEIGTVTAIRTQETLYDPHETSWPITRYRVYLNEATFDLGDVTPLRTWAFHSDSFKEAWTASVYGPRGHTAAKRLIKEDVATLIACWIDAVTVLDTEPTPTGITAERREQGPATSCHQCGESWIYGFNVTDHDHGIHRVLCVDCAREATGGREPGPKPEGRA